MQICPFLRDSTGTPGNLALALLLGAAAGKQLRAMQKALLRLLLATVPDQTQRTTKPQPKPSHGLSGIEFGYTFFLKGTLVAALKIKDTYKERFEISHMQLNTVRTKLC